MKKLICWLLLAICLPISASLVLKDASYAVCFTPGENCTQLVVDKINAAKNSIRMQAYSFTSMPIVKALIDAHRRGVDVLVLLDKSNVKQKYSVTNTLTNNGIPFLIDWRPAIAHNKIIIIDALISITGSFNFTKAAQEKNAENVLLISDKNLAARYRENFNRRQAVSESLDSYCEWSRRC